MKIFNFNLDNYIDYEEINNGVQNGDSLFIISDQNSIKGLSTIFNLDKSTILECTNLDESVRYSPFDGYDFLSLVYMYLDGKKIFSKEINLYVSKNYIILVLPNEKDNFINDLENVILCKVHLFKHRENFLNKIYYSIFDKVLTDLSYTLEYIEDELENIQKLIEDNVSKEHFLLINEYKHISYTLKKQIRPLYYMGSEILVNENDIITKKYIKYFKSIDIRIKKLYDLSSSLYELSNNLIYSYDSSLSMKTNEIVTKLTIITVFFGPLTVITGIFGMNFINMPELKWKFGYPYAIFLMIFISIIVYIILKKRKWL